MRYFLIGVFLISGTWCAYLIVPLVKVKYFGLAVFMTYIPFNLMLIGSLNKSYKYYERALNENRISKSSLVASDICEEEYNFISILLLVLLTLFYSICIFFYYYAE